MPELHERPAACLPAQADQPLLEQGAFVVVEYLWAGDEHTRLSRDGLNHARMAVPDNGRTVSADAVDIHAAVSSHTGAFTAHDGDIALFAQLGMCFRV